MDGRSDRAKEAEPQDGLFDPPLLLRDGPVLLGARCVNGAA